MGGEQYKKAAPCNMEAPGITPNAEVVEDANRPSGDGKLGSIFQKMRERALKNDNDDHVPIPSPSRRRKPRTRGKEQEEEEGK